MKDEWVQVLLSHTQEDGKFLVAGKWSQTRRRCPCHGTFYLTFMDDEVLCSEPDLARNILYLEGFPCPVSFQKPETGCTADSMELGGEEHCTCCGEWRPCPCDQGKCPND